MSWQDLKDLMRRVADVSYANAHNDRRNEGYDLQSLSDSFLQPQNLTACKFEVLQSTDPIFTDSIITF